MRAMRGADVAWALWWFEQTHELAPAGIGAYWRQSWLPRSGSVGEQDAWLHEAMHVIRIERTRMLAESQRDDRQEAELKAWRQRRRRERGD